jgi:hypothetical protein
VNRSREWRILFIVNVFAAAFMTGLLGMAWPPWVRAFLVGSSVALWLLAVTVTSRP